jgi:hypothetical protein
MRKIRLPISIVMLLIGGMATGQSGAPGKKFENHYLTITILPGWTVEPSVDQNLNIVHGKYHLSVNPIFTHATSVARFEQVAVGPSVEAVTSKLDDPSDSYKCALWPPKKMIVNKAMSLSILYTTASKSDVGCTFFIPPRPNLTLVVLSRPAASLSGSDLTSTARAPRASTPLR